jgi:ligand-binding sensor domain-containing protein
VTAIAEDEDRTLWFGTDNGVSCYENPPLGKGGEGGFLWFATGGGLTRYRRSDASPSVRIASVQTDRTYTDLTALPSITAGNRVTIKYHAIDFKTHPEKRQYRTRITNYESKSTI